MPHNYLLQRNANKLDVLLRNAENNLPTTYAKVIDYLQSFELFDLIDLLDANKGIFLRLSHERYNSFWEHTLESILEDDQEKDSENEINNAYYEMSLTQSNPFSIDTISKMKEFCIERLNLKLSNEINKTLHDIAVSELRSDLGACHDNIAATLNSADIDNSSKENSINQYRENPLLIAARLNDEKAFKLMLEKNMDIKQVDKQGNSALHLAVLANNKSISIDLLEKDHSLLEIKNHNGDRAIELVENKEMKELLTIHMKSDHKTQNDLSFFKSTKQLKKSLAQGSPNKLFQI